MTDEIGNRFISLFEELEKKKIIKSRTDTASALNYKPQAFTEILKGRTKVGLELLQNFCINFGINPNYLILGKGPQFIADEKYASNEDHIINEPDVRYGKLSENNECDLCKQKDETIHALKEIIQMQKTKITELQNKIEALKKIKTSGNQKG